jgi:hypothetical protein
MGVERFTRKGVALRKSPRERKDNVVRIELDDGAPSLRGALSDLSATGARISLSAPYKMPAKFTLVLPPNTRRLCRLVWQSQENLGVEFLAAAARAPAKTGPGPAASAVAATSAERPHAGGRQARVGRPRRLTAFVELLGQPAHKKTIAVLTRERAGIGRTRPSRSGMAALSCDSQFCQ